MPKQASVPIVTLSSFISLFRVLGERFHGEFIKHCFKKEHTKNLIDILSSHKQKNAIGNFIHVVLDTFTKPTVLSVTHNLFNICFHLAVNMKIKCILEYEKSITLKRKLANRHLLPNRSETFGSNIKASQTFS